MSDLVRAHLDAIAMIVRERPVAVRQLRGELESLLSFLASPAGRTDENCSMVDHVLMNDDLVWEALDEIEATDPGLAEVLADMAGALHDTVSSPEVAENFESSPEQLLARLIGGRPA